MKLPLPGVSRRLIVANLIPLLTAPISRQAAFAFDNALPDVKADGPSVKPGPKPTLGVQKNGNLLLPCLDGKPHCFSTATTVGQNVDNSPKPVDTSKIGRDWIVQPWSYSGKSVAGALIDVKAAVDAYPPGQGGIDEGGFQIASVRIPGSADDYGYLNVQFEARAGYLDDMEFRLQDGVVQVRTSSRVGYLDFGVNAKRYNWFASRLAKQNGWKTSSIKLNEHLEYFDLNQLESNKAVGL